MKPWASVFIVLLAASPAYGMGASDDCSRTAETAIYSNAFTHEETGDLLGYELLIKRHNDSTVKAFFYIYQGAPSAEAIPLSGHLSAEKLSIRGNWVEHLTEYPGKKKIVQTHAVEISGVLNTASFRGVVTIDDQAKKESIRLTRVNSIWVCKK